MQEKNFKISIKSANIIILIISAMAALYTLLMPANLANIISLTPTYLIEVVIILIFCRINKANIKTATGFNKVKPITYLLVFLLCITIHPFINMFGVLTNIFIPGGNEAISSQLLNNGFILNTIFAAILPALVEEFIFRGMLLNTYVQTNRLRASILLSALVFALYHFNLIQGLYAFVLGIIIGLIFVLTDSVLPCMLFHFTFNGISVVKVALLSKYNNEVSSLLQTSNASTTHMASIISIASIVIGFIISIFLFKAIAKKENSTDKLSLCLKGSNVTGGKLLTPPLIISLLLMSSLAIITTLLLYVQLTHN